MRKLRQFGIAAALILGLTGSAIAGDIWIPGAPPPPQSSSTTTTPGDIDMPGDKGAPTTSDSSFDVALNLLQSVLSIF